MVPTSHKGRLIKAASYTAVRVAPDVIAALAPAINGRQGHEPLFMRPHWTRTPGRVAWERSDERVAWRGVNDLRRPWLTIVERAGLPATVSALRLAAFEHLPGVARYVARANGRALARHVGGDDRGKLQP